LDEYEALPAMPGPGSCTPTLALPPGKETALEDWFINGPG
jgi:hypothetical protein